MAAITESKGALSVMRLAYREHVMLAIVAVGAACLPSICGGVTIEVTSRLLYGPGPFPDQQLEKAWIRNLNLDAFLNGRVKGFNNLAEQPNVSGEVLQGKIVDGRLSDKTLINESIDMSNAVIMNGQFNLLLAAVYGGPNGGDTLFYLDERFNWWIKDDIAIDPGFPAGVVKIDNFTFSTGPRVIPFSIQTEFGYPGGTNQTGSLEAGRLASGRLGDDDGDGFLDGQFNAIGRFPMDSIFLPGAPFVQLFEFTSDIPVTPLEAAMLTLANGLSYVEVLKEIVKLDAEHRDVPIIKKNISLRIAKTIELLRRSSRPDQCITCNSIDAIIKQLELIVGENDGSSSESLLSEVLASIVRINDHEE